MDANLQAFSIDASARYKAIELLEAKIQLLDQSPSTKERAKALDIYKDKLAQLKSLGIS